MGSLKGKEVFMKRRFLIRGSCLVLAIGMTLAGTGCEKRKRVPEDMTLGDEYLEKIVLASDVEERDFEEDGIRYHEFKTKKMIVTYPLIEKKVKSETEIRQESFSLRTDKSFFIGDRSFDYKKRTCWYKYVALPYVDRDDKMVKKEYSLYNAKGYIKQLGDSYKETIDKIGISEADDIFKVNGTDKQIIENGDTHRPIIVLFGDENSSATSYNDLNVKFCKELNKAVIRIDTTYTDGTAETKYYKIKTYNNNTFTHYTFYEVEFD